MAGSSGSLPLLMCRQMKPLRTFRSIRFSRLKQTMKPNEVQCFQYSSQQTRQLPKLRPSSAKGDSNSSGYPLLVIPLTCVGLGIWQVQRKLWKEGVIKELEDKMQRRPIPLPGDLDDLCHKENEYTKVVARGTFDHSREIFIGPRSNINFQSSTPDPHASMGVFVVTPFKLSGREETILVNRGHVTFKRQPQDMRQDGQVEGEVELTGVVRLTERRNMMSDSKQSEGTWGHRDIEEMAYYAQTYPFFVDADRQSSVPGGPVGGQTRVTIRNEHLSYIFTWFSLAAFTFLLWQRNNSAVKVRFGKK